MIKIFFRLCIFFSKKYFWFCTCMCERIGMHIVMHIANSSSSQINTVFMVQIFLLKTVWYLQMTSIQLKTQDIFSANQMTNTATILSICEIHCSILQFAMSIKNQFHQLFQQQSYTRGTFGLDLSPKKQVLHNTSLPLSENTSPLHMTRVRPVWENLFEWDILCSPEIIFNRQIYFTI